MRPLIIESTTRFEGDLGLEGFMGARRQAQGRRKLQVLEAARLIADVAQGRTDPFLLKQAFNPSHEFGVRALIESYPGLMNLREAPIGGMSVTDFSALTLDVLDRLLYGNYTATPVISLPLVKQHPLRDFRSVSRYLIDGATTPSEVVDPGAQPKEKTLINNAPIQYAPLKYESFTRVVWEAMINDDLGIFTDLAQRLVIGANRGIEMFLTGLYIGASGPNANLYNSTYANIINIANGAASNNPPLDIQGIQDAYKILAGMRDVDGYPIIITGKMYLWYGPALTAKAQNLMHMMSAQLSVNGGTANTQGFPTQFIEVNNWAVQNLIPIMNPFIPLVATSANSATTWGITCDPNAQARPSIEFGFLNGFQTPQVFQKVPNTMRAGGGVDPSLGDFYTMSHELKVLSVYGGKVIDGRSTVASNGSGA
jgi:hypothetical protein